MIKKQRVTKLLSILSVSLGIVIATLFSNTQEIKAYTNYATDGSWSISTYLHLSAPSQTGQSDIAHLYGTINFNDPSTGSITLNLYNLVSISYSALIENAAISVKNNTKIILNFKECTYIEFDLVVDAQDLLAKIVSGGYASTLNTALTYLRNHEATVFNVRSSTRSTSIDITTDDILIDMNTTMGYIDSELDDIKTDLQTISSQLTTINNTLLNMDGIGSSGGSSYSWNSYQTQYVAMLAKMGVTWDSSVLNSMYVANGLSAFNQNLGTNQFYIHPNSTLHIIHLSNSGGAYYVKQNATTYTDLLDNITSDVVNAYGGSGIVLNHITITNNTNSTITGYFWRANASQWIYPIFWGYVVPDEVLSLLGKDTTTNTLLLDILEAMSNINITVQNNQEINNVVNNKNTTITNITNQHNTVNNITNDFTVDFTTADNAITFDSNIITSLTDTATFWNGKMSEVEVSLGNLHYPIVLGFILLALLALIGG